MDRNAKEKRNEKYEATVQQLLSNGYNMRTQIFGQIIVFVLGLLVALSLVLLIRYFHMEQLRYNQVFLAEEALASNLIIVGIMLVSMVVHELIHSITFCVFCDIWLNGLLATCHCEEPLSSGRYALVVAMPFLILGSGTTVALFLFPSAFTLAACVLNILGAGGDLMLLLVIFVKYRKGLIFGMVAKPGIAVFMK